MSTPFDPGNAFQQAVGLMRSGDSARAADLLRRVVRYASDNPQVLFLLGTAELQLGNAPDAVANLEKSLQLAPNQPSALCNLGVGLRMLHRHKEALTAFDRAVALTPNYAMAHNNRGITLVDLGRADEAAASFKRATDLEPRYAEAHNNRANVLRDLGQVEESLEGYDRAISLTPDYVAAHFNRGTALQMLCRPQQALESFGRAVALDPHNAEAHCGYTTALYNLKRLDEATISNDRALSLDPGLAEAHWNKARIALVRGDFPAGWESFEWRWKLPEFAGDARAFPQPRWDGSQTIAGKTLFVYSEQGYGDAIQFCRYLPMVRALGADVIFEAPKRLLPLLAGQMQSVEKGGPPPEFDLQCPLMSLPRAFGTTIETVPADVPYLSADLAKRASVMAQLGAAARPRVGIAWSGNPKQNVDRARSIPLRHLEPLLALPFEFHSLQKEHRAEDAERLAGLPQIARHEKEQKDFSDAAALVDAMDLVITSDTVIAHLAGAMGKPVWILLPWMADWRWLLDREDCPWYPTATLIRQRSDGDWAGVIASVIARLNASPPGIGMS